MNTVGSKIFRVIDLEEEKQNQRNRRLLLVTLVVSLALLAYGPAKEYQSKWQALRAARKLGAYLQHLMTEAVKEQRAFEIRMSSDHFVEKYEVDSCGINPKAKILEKLPVSEFGSNVRLAQSHEYQGELSDGEEVAVLGRFCFDPLQGSSLTIDGVIRGSIFLAAGQEDGGIALARLNVEGQNAQLSIE